MNINKIVSTGIAALFVVCTAHGATNYQELSKELEIMNSVLNTALKQDTRDQAIKFRSMQTSYLANQGVVFTLSTTGKATRVFFENGFPAPPEPIPVLDLSGSGVFSHDMEIELQETIHEALDSVKHHFSGSHDRLQDLRSESRDLAWEVREYERRKRDLNFALRNAEASRAKELKDDLKELEKELVELSKKQADIQAYSAKIESEQKALIEKKQAESEQAKKSFLASFEEGIADTLCRFGGGLRAIPNNENVSFVLRGFNKNHASQDKIYVFKVEDVKKCVQEKIKVSKLLANAIVYDF